MLPRPFIYDVEFTLTELASVRPPTSASEPRQTIRDQLLAYSEVKGLSRRIFGSLKDANRYWPELQGYVRQALSYDAAASLVPDPSSGLLLYYSSLNLAKAELLVRSPAVVFKKRIGHGLSYNPSTGSTFLTDFLTVEKNGVFSELFHARTGYRIPSKFRLTISDLLCRIPEISSETPRLGLDPVVRPALMRVRASDSELWMAVNFPIGLSWIDSQSTGKYLLRALQRSDDTGVQVNFDSIATSPRAFGGPIQAEEIVRVRQVHKDILGPLISPDLHSYAVATPSIRKTSFVPMPPDLARYALIYYLSSVARYRPSLLATGEARWILGVFVADSPLKLLSFGLDGISGLHHRYIRQLEF
jgi:YaaC-like Protein